MDREENIIAEFSRIIYAIDELDKAAYTVALEDIFRDVHKIGYLDIDYVEKLDSLAIYFVDYLVDYKKVSEREAIALITYFYITYDIMLDVLEDHLRGRIGRSY